MSGDAPWDPQAPNFRDQVTNLAAPVHGKTKYELASDDVSEQRKIRRLRRVAIAVLVVLTLLALAAATIAFLQRQETPGRQTQTSAFAGTYAVQFAVATMPNGQPYQNAPGGREHG